MPLDNMKDLLEAANDGVFEFGATEPEVLDVHPAEAFEPAADETATDEFLKALKLDTWTSGQQMDTLAARLEREVETAARHEDEMAPSVLATLERSLPNAADRSVESGVYSLRVEDVVKATSNILFNGCVEAADGTRVTVPTLPLTVYQIGICLTSYQGAGDGGALGNRFYRQDITSPNANPETQVLDFLMKRSRRKRNEIVRPETGADGHPMDISDMMSRALMIYGERAMLCDRSSKPWRMGHGGPMPHEMITGSGRNAMAFASVDMLRRLLIGHKRFIFVPSEISDYALVTIANALRPLQYAVIRNTWDIIDGYMDGSSFNRPHYRDSGLYAAVREFQKDVAPKVLLCVYRASAICPGQLFYAHEDYVHEAAQIVMADSVMQEARGFPNLIDVADRLCRGFFEPGGVSAQVQAAFAKSGASFRYLAERDTRA